MNTRLQTSLIITTMVTLCMFALPGVVDRAERADAPVAATAFQFTLPLNDAGLTVEVQIAAKQACEEANDDPEPDCADEPGQIAANDRAGFSTAALTSGFEMPFFSVAGLLRGAVSQ